MTLGTYGNSIYIGTAFDLSQNTQLEIEAKSPNGATKTFTGVTAPGVDSPNIPDVGIFPANTYGLYNTLEGDFDVSGTWRLNIVYHNSNATPPQRFEGACFNYQVEECN